MKTKKMLLHSIALVVCLRCCALQAAILPHTTIIKSKLGTATQAEKLGYLEYQPNGTLLLHAAPPKSSTSGQSFLLLRSVLGAVKLMPLSTSATRLNIKMYGDGTEQKFPPLLERLIQRIQTYFSVYRYTDTSRPDQPVVISDATAAVATTNLIAADGLPTSTTMGKVEDETPIITTTTTVLNLETADEVNDFISIGENDGFISVGED